MPGTIRASSIICGASNLILLNSSECFLSPTLSLSQAAAAVNVCLFVPCQQQMYHTCYDAMCILYRASPSDQGVAALSALCGGDGLSDIVGRRLGAGNKLWFNKNKSVAGSAAMFLGAFGFSMGLTSAFHSLGGVAGCTLDSARAHSGVRVLNCTV
jgi:hypothetical protein